MATLIQGKADLVKAYEYYTIFPDVRTGHWAAGYINLAVRGETKLLSGFSDGSFGPEREITYGEAVTILMRLLGYADADVGVIWPTGYLVAASENGLTEGLSGKDGNAHLTRGEAALLFVNLLTTTIKDGTQQFGHSVASAVQTNVLLLDTGAETAAGTRAVETSDAVVELAGSYVPQLLQGMQGDLLMNSAGKAWGFVPSGLGSSLHLTIAEVSATGITDTDGRQRDIPGSATVYYKGTQTTYADIFFSLRAGTRVTLHMGQTGDVTSLFVADSSAGGVAVVLRDGSTDGFTALAGGRSDYTIYRHGEAVTALDVRAYDVATYHAADRSIYLSTFRLTGHYDNAYPNPAAPVEITALGHDFTVLESAQSQLAAFSVGDEVTLLLTEEGDVAGAVSPRTLRSDAVGIANGGDGHVTVELLEGLSLSGKVEGSIDYDGLLVTVSSWRDGYLKLSEVKDRGTTDDFDVSGGTLGDHSLSADVRIFERVGEGRVIALAREDISMETVPASQIAYVRYHENGKVAILILDDVSGNAYQYGKVYLATVDPGPDSARAPYTTATLLTPDGSLGPFETEALRGSGTWYGLAIDESKERIVGSILLDSVFGVTNEDFIEEDFVFLAGTGYRVAEDVICYNRNTDTFISYTEARAWDTAMQLRIDPFDVVRVIEVG